IEVRGSVEGTASDGTEFEIKYSLELSPQWEIQHVIVRDVKNEGNELDLQRENGQWFDVDGLHLEEFDDVEYVDLSFTPLTNTLPIKRLHLEGNEPQKIDVLYIELPAFSFQRAEQYYARLGKHTYRYYEAKAPDSVADLVVDDDGLVLIYPGLFTSAATAAGAEG
ncbi:MAG TPA: putative glycolipid-binding domain-containing protein, partial [Candidatus Saccharimonadales bacterium]|nr:putative glycolipid-binding domain-containing protein [Candidatus Saccharimonadales bacterium]